MNIYAIINGINALCAFVVICSIISKKFAKPVHFAALLWYLSLFFWTSSYFVWGFQKDIQGSMFWLQLLLYPCVFIHVAYFHFLLAFCNRLTQYKKILYAGYASSAVFFAINAFNGFVDWSYTRSFPPFPYWPHASPLLAVVIGTQILIVAISLRIMSKTIAESPEPLRTRINLFHLTAAAAWLGGLTNWFQFYDVTPIPPVGNLGVLLYMVAGFYLLYKHDILGLNIVIKRTFTYAILTLFITLVFTLFIVLSERLFRSYLGYNSLVATLLAAATITLCFNPLRGAISSFIDKRFFGKNIETLSRENLQMMSELQEQDKMRSIATLAAGMAHEIKNPLTTIMTFAEHLESKYNDPDFRGSFKNIMLKEVRRANDIVSQLLEFAKPRPPNLKSASLESLINDTLDFMSVDFIKHQIRVVKEFGNSTPVRMDANQIKQVLLNLFLNSVRAMPSGGVLTVRTLNDPGSSVKLVIRDTGSGIEKSQISRIFEPFYTTSTDSGTGLGLAIVYNIVKEHDGSIAVASTPNEYTEFTICLKIA